MTLGSVKSSYVLALLFCALVISIAFAGFRVSLRAEQPTLFFTAIPDRDEDDLVKRFTPLALYFERTLGIKVRYVPVNTYEAAIKAFSNNKVQLAWFGGYSGLKARRAVPGSALIAQGYEDANFKSYFIAHSSAGLKPSIEFPKEIMGKTFIFGSPSSTSGRLVPEYWIRRRLGPPAKVFARVSFSGDHSSTLQLIQAGVSQIGVMDYTVYEAAKRAGKVDEAKVSVIWETPSFPDNAFIVREGADRVFGKGFTARIQRAIVQINDRTILNSFQRSRFVPANAEQYEFLEELAAQIEDEEKLAAK